MGDLHNLITYNKQASSFVAISWTAIVVHSKDEEGVGAVHKINSPKKQPQFSHMTTGQCWLGKAKPNQVLTKWLNKLLQNFKNYLTGFSMTN